MTTAQRIHALRRYGFEDHAIAAMIGAEVADVAAFLIDNEASVPVTSAGVDDDSAFQIVSEKGQPGGYLPQSADAGDAGKYPDAHTGAPTSLPGGSSAPTPPVVSARIGIDGSPWIIAAEDLSIPDPTSGPPYAWWGTKWAVKFFQWTPPSSAIAVLPTLAIPDGATGIEVEMWKGTQEGVDYPPLHALTDSGFTALGSGGSSGPGPLNGEPGVTFTIGIEITAASRDALVGIEVDTLPIALALFPQNPVIKRAYAAIHSSSGGPLSSVAGAIPTEQFLGVDLSGYGGGYTPFYVPTQDILAAGGHIGPHLEDFDNHAGVILSVTNPNFTVIKNDGSAGFAAAANGTFDLPAVNADGNYNVSEIDWASAVRVGTDLSYDSGQNRVVSAAGGAVQALFFGRLTARLA